MKGRLYNLVKSKEEVESLELFNSMLERIESTGGVQIDGRNLLADSVYAKHIVAGEITSDLIHAGAITADKIHSGAITTEKLDTNAITADKIHSGAITTEKLDADAITADMISSGSLNLSKGIKLTNGAGVEVLKVDDKGKVLLNVSKLTINTIDMEEEINKKASHQELEQAIQSVEIGGRNYFSYSYHSDRDNYDFSSSYSHSKEPIQLQPNTEYTLSYEEFIRFETGQYVLFLIDSSDTRVLSIFNVRGMDSGTEPIAGQKEYRFTTNDDGLYRFSYYANGKNNNTAPEGEWFTDTFLGFQIEKGNTATDWTPAPEDVDKKISNVYDYAHQVNITTEKHEETFSSLEQLSNGDLIKNFQDITSTAKSFERVIGSHSLGDSKLKENIASISLSDSRFNAKVDNLTKDMSTKLDLTAEGLKSTVKKDGLIAEFNMQAGQTLISNKKIVLDAATVNFTGSAFIPGAFINNASIDSAKIQNTAITNAKIANGAITNAKIDNLAVNSAKIADGAITSAKIGNAQIGTAEIANGSITNAKISDLSADKIKAGVIKSIDSKSSFELNLRTGKVTMYDAYFEQGEVGGHTVDLYGFNSNYIGSPSYSTSISNARAIGHYGDTFISLSKGSSYIFEVDGNGKLKADGGVDTSNISASSLNASGSIYAGAGIEVNSHITPRLNNYENLGSSSKKFKNAYLSGTVNANIGQFSGSLNAGGIYSDIANFGQLEVNSNLAAESGITVNSHITPRYSGYEDLGSSSRKFRTGHIDTVRTDSLNSSSGGTLKINSSNTIQLGENLRPTSHDKYALGNAGYRWSAVYGVLGSFNTSSDSRFKEEQKDVPKELVEFFAKEVKPKQFVADGKTHYGYIAQDVERALHKYATSVKNIKSTKELKDFVNNHHMLQQGESYKSLVYDEVHSVKIAQQENELERLKEELKLKDAQLEDQDKRIKRLEDLIIST